MHQTLRQTNEGGAMMVDQLLNEKEVAKNLCLSLKTLRKWHRLRLNITFVKLGKWVRYRSSVGQNFTNANLREVKDE